jgi:hypothetical protein
MAMIWGWFGGPNLVNHYQNSSLVIYTISQRWVSRHVPVRIQAGRACTAHFLSTGSLHLFQKWPTKSLRNFFPEDVDNNDVAPTNAPHKSNNHHSALKNQVAFFALSERTSLYLVRLLCVVWWYFVRYLGRASWYCIVCLMDPRTSHRLAFSYV